MILSGSILSSMTRSGMIHSSTMDMDTDTPASTSACRTTPHTILTGSEVAAALFTDIPITAISLPEVSLSHASASRATASAG